MPRVSTLNGLPNNLNSSFFSTLRYSGRGYMADWILNAAKHHSINNVTLDINNLSIEPKILESLPLLPHLESLQNIILKELDKNGFAPDFIAEAKIRVEIPDLNPGQIRLYCYPKLVDINGRVYEKGPIIEIAHEKPFDPFQNVNFFKTLLKGVKYFIRKLKV